MANGKWQSLSLPVPAVIELRVVASTGLLSPTLSSNPETVRGAGVEGEDNAGSLGALRRWPPRGQTASIGVFKASYC